MTYEDRTTGLIVYYKLLYQYLFKIKSTVLIIYYVLTITYVVGGLFFNLQCNM